jgi:hypothetical protein
MPTPMPTAVVALLALALIASASAHVSCDFWVFFRVRSVQEPRARVAGGVALLSPLRFLVEEFAGFGAPVWPQCGSIVMFVCVCVWLCVVLCCAA